MHKLRDHVNNVQVILLGAALVCYAAGYPLGIVSHSAIGWVLVTLGGVFLVALGTVTVRRIHQIETYSRDTSPR
jgi:hypothetical protein